MLLFDPLRPEPDDWLPVVLRPDDEEAVPRLDELEEAVPRFDDVLEREPFPFEVSEPDCERPVDLLLDSFMA